jgi:tetratricopeptide (TPR) repeat protein
MERVFNNMRIKDVIYAAAALVICFAGVGLSLDSPVSSNSLGLGTVPPTAYKSGLIPSINPIDTSSNRVITGNVTGGMYFRGIVPYSSVTDLSVPPRSGIESFLRRTEGSQVYGNSGSGLTPYYSPLTTVSRIVPGTGGEVTTQQLVSGYRSESFPGTDLQNLQNQQLGSEQTGYYQGRYRPSRYMISGEQRPLSTNLLDIEKTIDFNAMQYPTGIEAPASTRGQEQADYEARSQERFWNKIGVKMSGITGPSEQGLERQGLLNEAEPNIGFYLGVNQAGQGVVSGPTAMQQSVLGAQEKSQTDVYEQMKIQTQVSKPVKRPEGLTEKGDESTIGQILGVEPKTEDRGQRTEDGRQKTTLSPEDYTGQAEDREKKAEETAATTGSASNILNIYKSFASYHDDKFNSSMRAAEYYMKQGRFYRAADAYTLATVYKPEDPLGYAGKSIAMFATGEYMSSALYLARTLEIFPEYAKIRVDLVAVIGDKDTVENRILEAREWLGTSESGELAFLLSYVYYQMDRLEFARQMIEFAAKQMPDSQAIAIMKKAIEERIANK